MLGAGECGLGQLHLTQHARQLPLQQLHLGPVPRSCLPLTGPQLACHARTMFLITSILGEWHFHIVKKVSSSWHTVSAKRQAALPYLWGEEFLIGAWAFVIALDIELC